MELLKCDPTDSAMCDVTCTFKNSTPAEMTGFVFQAAVPKYLELRMRPPTGSVLPSGGEGVVTQVLSVKNTQLGLVCIVEGIFFT
jgi:AP-1 complex subunit gamma-1